MHSLLVINEINNMFIQLDFWGVGLGGDIAVDYYRLCVSLTRNDSLFSFEGLANGNWFDQALQTFVKIIVLGVLFLDVSTPRDEIGLLSFVRDIFLFSPDEEEQSSAWR